MDDFIQTEKEYYLMSEVLATRIRTLKQQLHDAFKEGKLDAVTYNSMIINVGEIEEEIFNIK